MVILSHTLCPICLPGYLPVCVSVCLCEFMPSVSSCLQRLKDGVTPFRSGITGSYELLSMDAGNQTNILWTSVEGH